METSPGTVLSCTILYYIAPYQYGTGTVLQYYSVPVFFWDCSAVLLLYIDAAVESNITCCCVSFLLKAASART